MRAKGLAPKRENSGPVEVLPYDDLLWVWNGFWRLSASRPVVAMAGPTRLPPSEVLAFATLQRWSPAKTQDFSYYIDAMDAKFMEFITEETEKKRQEQEKKQKAASKRR